jgi:hypothetical protein
MDWDRDKRGSFVAAMYAVTAEEARSAVEECSGRVQWKSATCEPRVDNIVSGYSERASRILSVLSM